VFSNLQISLHNVSINMIQIFVKLNHTTSKTSGFHSCYINGLQNTGDLTATVLWGKSGKLPIQLTVHVGQLLKCLQTGP
jgi:hypothetical protein